MASTASVRGKRAAEAPRDAAAKRNVRMKCDEAQDEAVVERELNALFSSGRDDVGFGELQCALCSSGQDMSVDVIEVALERMEAANKIMHREARIHLI